MNVRTLVNRVALGVICAGALALNPSEGAARDGGTCCDEAGATCYLSVGGTLVIQESASYRSGSCKDSE